MKHSGKAAQAALKLIFWTLVLLLALLAAGVVAAHFAALIAWAASALVGLWVLFAAFTFYFFRDPEPILPADPKAIVSPAHGTVDVIEEATEPEVMGGPCRRISIFLSVIDVHVQRAPVSGNVTHYKHKLGQFLSATKAHCAEFNENVLLGFECPAQGGAKIGLRLIAGLIARRIVPWVGAGETVQRSERISLIQFGSRCDLYLPRDARVQVQLGAKVKGGETVLAVFA